LTTSAGTGSEGFYNDDGTLITEKVKALARTYMPVTQGKLDSMNFNPETSEFTASFTVNTSNTTPSTLYFSTEFYYTGSQPKLTFTDASSNMSVTPSLDWSVANYVSFMFTDASLNGKQITLSLSNN
jgi:hypothetical protein